MGLIVDPYNFANGDIADAEQVDARFAAILAQVNGNLDAANLKDGGATKVKLATDAIQAFLQLLVGGDHKVAFGMDFFTFPGTPETTKTVTHGLGSIPVCILAMGKTTGGRIFAIGDDGRNATQVTFRGRTIDGTALGPGTIDFYWLAIS